jgi:endonuclease/exonuclease/phosphatase family metal-dependent hydrolase
MTSLRIMTMNMATGCGEPYVDFGAATHADFINRINPDVVMLQEVDRGTHRAGGVDQLAVLTERTALKDSHFVKWHNLEGGEYGVATISRLPFTAVSNRSVYQPAHWWPWFQTHRVVAPVTYARIETPEGPVHLYGTHFHLEPPRQKFAAETVSAEIPGGVATVLAGDFNNGPDSVELASIDRKLARAEAIAAQVDVLDRGEGIDHIYVTGGMTCDRWSTVSPLQGAPERRFSDHSIVFADLRTPTPPAPARALRTAVKPYPVPLGAPAVLTVSALDAASGAPVGGEVLVNGARVAATNTPFETTLRQERRREFDPDRHRWIMTVVNPEVSVTADTYPAESVDLGL